MKYELEDMILNEDVPTIQRVDALVDRLFLCHHSYAKFDLVQKGLAMLHELKFKVQGDADWKRILHMEYLLQQRLPKHHPAEEFNFQSKDTYDPRAWMMACRIPLASFIKEQIVSQLYYEGYDIDHEFDRVFGLESSPRVLRGESPVRWEGYDDDGPVDWGYYRAKRSRIGIANGHVQMAEEHEEQEEEPPMTEEESYDEEHFDNEEEDDGSEAMSDDDESDLEEISADIFRESSVAHGSSVDCEQSGDIESTGTQDFLTRQPPEDGYDEDDQSSRMSGTSDYSDHEVEEVYNDDDAYGDEHGDVYDEEEELFEEQSGGVHGKGAEQELEDYESVADSDDPQILEEYHHQDANDENFEELQWQGHSAYPTQDAVTAEATNEQGVDQASIADEESEDDEDDEDAGTIIAQQAVVMTISTDEGSEASADTWNGFEEEQDAEVTEQEEDLPQISQVSQPHFSSRISDLSSPQSSLDKSDAFVLDDVGSKHYMPYTNLATQALQRSSASQSIKTSDASGLSSPPSSLLSLNSEVDERSDSENNGTVGQTSDVTIDPALLDPLGDLVHRQQEDVASEEQQDRSVEASKSITTVVEYTIAELQNEQEVVLAKSAEVRDGADTRMAVTSYETVKAKDEDEDETRDVYE
jgi:hypothetical protein